MTSGKADVGNSEAECRPWECRVCGVAPWVIHASMFMIFKRSGEPTQFRFMPGCLVFSIVASIVLTILLNVLIRLF
jgi:hypothetical protein